MKYLSRRLILHYLQRWSKKTGRCRFYLVYPASMEPKALPHLRWL